MKQLFGLGLLTATLAFAAPSSADKADTTLFRPFGVDMLGATDTQALLKMTKRAGSESYYGVLDLGTSCVVETFASFPRVEKLIHLGYGSPFDRARTTALARQAVAAQMLADAATQAEIRQYIALRSRFGSRKDSESIYAGDLAWNADASRIVVVAGEAFFRSRDGGQSWEMLDTNMSRGPLVTRDGRFAFYQRCGDASVHNYSCLKAQQIAIVDLESAARPRIVEVPSGTIEGLDPSGQKLVVVRDDEPGKIVVTHLDPTTSGFARVFAIPAPPLKPNTFYTIDPSRNGNYGTFSYWVTGTAEKLAVVSMTDGRVLYSQQRQFVGTDVDDEGRLAWGTVNLVRSYGTTATGAVRDVGAGDRIGWAPGGRLLVFDTPKNENGKLGDAMCKTVKVVRIP